jgi:hypothetical protein
MTSELSVRRWQQGDVILRREVLNDGRPWLEFPVFVVQDEPELFATYLASGTSLHFPTGPWPTGNGLHPWHGQKEWEGHGVLMLQRPGDMHAVWVLWQEPRRRFHSWYLNIQEPFRRTDAGYDTQDLELDIVIEADGSWRLKDADVLEQRISEGRYRPDQIDDVRREAARLTGELDAGRRWWSDDWSRWTPDPAWSAPSFIDEPKRARERR